MAAKARCTCESGDRECELRRELDHGWNRATSACRLTASLLLRPPPLASFARLHFHAASRRAPLQALSFWPGRATALTMKNGLYSVHIHMLDGVKGRDSGVLFLRDGELVGGGPYFWSVGSYTVDHGTWKGDLRTNQHTPFADPFVRPLFGGQEVTSGFSGTFADDRAEVFGTTLVGNRSLSFRATLKKLADD